MFIYTYICWVEYHFVSNSAKLNVYTYIFVGLSIISHYCSSLMISVCDSKYYWFFTNTNTQVLAQHQCLGISIIQLPQPAKLGHRLSLAKKISSPSETSPCQGEKFSLFWSTGIYIYSKIKQGLEHQIHSLRKHSSIFSACFHNFGPPPPLHQRCQHTQGPATPPNLLM